MTPCAEWSEALIDCALGEPPDASLRSHLAVCPNCSAALDAWREKAVKIDDAIAQSTAATPPPFSAERILAEIELRPGRSVVRWPYWIASALAVLIVMIFFTAKRPTQSDALKLATLSTWRSPTQSLLRSPADPLLKSVPRLGESLIDMNTTGVQNVP